MNIQATSPTPVADACPAQPAQPQSVAAESDGLPSFVELLVEAVEPGTTKMPVTRKTTPTETKPQKDGSETVALFFALLPQSLPATDAQAPLTLDAQTGNGSGNSDSQPATQAVTATEAVEPPQPEIRVETPVAFTAEIRADVEPKAAPATEPVAVPKPKTLTTEIPVKAEEAPKAAEPAPQAAVATVAQPAPAKVEEQPRQERTPVVAHEAIRESHNVTEVRNDAVPATNKVQEIRIRVQGEGQQNAEVRVESRGSEVHVAVKTNDAQLTETLRSDLGELTSRLERTGLEARVWQPTAATPATVETERSSQQQSFDDRQEQPRWSFSDRQGRDRRRRDEQQQAFENQIEAIA